MYAYEIRKEINKRFKWKPALVTSYLVLYKLQRGGHVTTEWQEQRGRPARKYYKITAEGQKLMREAEKYFKDLYFTLFPKKKSPS